MDLLFNCVWVTEWTALCRQLISPATTNTQQGKEFQFNLSLIDLKWIFDESPDLRLTAGVCCVCFSGDANCLQPPLMTLHPAPEVLHTDNALTENHSLLVIKLGSIRNYPVPAIPIMMITPDHLSSSHSRTIILNINHHFLFFDTSEKDTTTTGKLSWSVRFHTRARWFGVRL